MAENTKIEWADHTFNPWEGCQKVGPGCDNCYAETRNARFGGGVAVNWGPGAPRRRTSAANWLKPMQWEAQAKSEGRRFRVFCASLADVFDNDVPPVWRADLFDLIKQTPNLDWLLLTKRIGATWKLMADACGVSMLSLKIPLPNVWLGATVVNQAEADRDIPKLLAVPARVRFLSIEPMLGPLDLQKACTRRCPNGDCFSHEAGRRVVVDSENGGTLAECICSRLNGLHWVICGGESGHAARPMHPDWARSLRDQCAAAGVPFLFKQWGEWTEQDGHKPTRTFSMDTDVGETLASRCDGFISQAGEFVRDMDDATTDEPYRGMLRIGKKAAGRLLDGVEHNGFPNAELSGRPARAWTERAAAVGAPLE